MSQQIDRELDILFLETPSTIFHFLCGTYDEKQLRMLDEKFSNVISRVDSLEESTERKPRIARIQLAQAVIDKMIDYNKLSASIDDIKVDFEKQLTIKHGVELDLEVKLAETVFNLENTNFKFKCTKDELEQMTKNYSIVEQLFKKTQYELQQKIIDYEIRVQSHTIPFKQPNIEMDIDTELQQKTIEYETLVQSHTISFKQPDIEMDIDTELKQVVETQKTCTDEKFESLVCDNEELRTNNRNMSDNISRLQSTISDKNREIEKLAYALRVEQAKNVKLNEAIKIRNDKLAEYGKQSDTGKNPYVDLLGTILNPPSFVKK